MIKEEIINHYGRYRKDKIAMLFKGIFLIAEYIKEMLCVKPLTQVQITIVGWICKNRNKRSHNNGST